MHNKKVTIIGSGPNSVNALDIILKLILRKKIKNNISEIVVCDENGLFGCGNTHNVNLHQSIILNRIAGQVALGAAPFIKFPHSLSKYDPNFMGWLNSNYKKTKNKKYKLLPTDWPSRKLLGEALINKLCDLLKIYKKKTKIKIKLLNTRVLKIKRIKKNYYLTTSQSRDNFEADKILICTGVTRRSETKGDYDMRLKKLFSNTQSKYISDFLNVIPNKKFFKKYKKRLNICLFGAGVSSLDIINFYFAHTNNSKVNIFPISRSGLFPFARPVYQTQKNTKKYEHKPILFKNELLMKLKKILIKNNNSNRISVEKTILPLLKIEFYLIYFKEYLSNKHYAFLFKSITLTLKEKINSNKFFNNQDLERIGNEIIFNFVINKKLNKSFYHKNWFSQKIILDSILKKENTFFDAFCNPLFFNTNYKNYKKNYIKFLNWDINEAKKGNLSSPYKKACDGTLRDLRPQLTYLIDNNTFNLKSFKFFLNNILPIHNRLADGPSLKNIVKIKNLIKKGSIIIDKNLSFNRYKFNKKKNKIYLNLNKKSIPIDILFYSILQLHKSNYKNDSLINSMINNKLVTINPKYKFGLKLSNNLHPLSKNNIEDKNITFAGPSSEGTKFFHHTLARPDRKQPIIIDLEKWAKSI